MSFADLARTGAFEGAYLYGADLTGTNLKGANLTGTNLTGAVFDKYTVWPDGFDPIIAGAIDRSNSR